MKKSLHGAAFPRVVAAPSSKSEAQRYLLCAALADAPTEIVCRDTSRDIEAMAACLNALGATVTQKAGGFSVSPIVDVPRRAVLDCGESGATLRFLLPVAAVLGIDAEFRLHGRLGTRPIAPLLSLLAANGCNVTRTETALRFVGKLRGASFCVDGSLSSQYAGGLLLALPLLDHDTFLHITPPRVSAGYIDLTRQIQAHFGVRAEPRGDGFFLPRAQRYRSPSRCTVGGDWSNAAFWLCAGALSRPVTVTGLSAVAAQPDRAVTELLRRFGAAVTEADGAVAVRPQTLHGISADLSGCPDLLPPLCAVAAFAEGTTRFSGIGRLRHKESDRPRVLAAMLEKCGARATLDGDTLTVTGGTPRAAELDAANDHRIAMTAALLSLRCPITLTGAEAVEKSYPNFWELWEGRT